MIWTFHHSASIARQHNQFSGTTSYGKFPFLAARCTGESKVKFCQVASAPASRRMATLTDWENITAQCRAVLPFSSCSKHNTVSHNGHYPHEIVTKCNSRWSFEIYPQWSHYVVISSWYSYKVFTWSWFSLYHYISIEGVCNTFNVITCSLRMCTRANILPWMHSAVC